MLKGREEKRKERREEKGEKIKRGWGREENLVEVIYDFANIGRESEPLVGRPILIV